jgi:hypothetical protein
VLVDQFRQILNLPNRLGQASGRDARCGVNLAEIVVHEIKRDRVAVILNLL